MLPKHLWVGFVDHRGLNLIKDMQLFLHINGTLPAEAVDKDNVSIECMKLYKLHAWLVSNGYRPFLSEGRETGLWTKETADHV